MKPQDKKLVESVKKEISRQEKAQKERKTLLVQSIYLGTIGIVMALPIVIGAYLGRWLDDRLKGFSFSWTVSLIVIGVFVGAMNVYFFLKEGE